MIKYYTWLTTKDVSSEPDIYYIYNLPIDDPSDGSEAGFYLQVNRLSQDDPSSFDYMEFTFNNADLESLKEMEYEELKDNNAKDLLKKQVLKMRRHVVRKLFTLNP